MQALIPRIHGLPRQADGGKGRHGLDDDAKLIPSPTLTELTREMQALDDDSVGEAWSVGFCSLSETWEDSVS